MKKKKEEEKRCAHLSITSRNGGFARCLCLLANRTDSPYTGMAVWVLSAYRTENGMAQTSSNQTYQMYFIIINHGILISFRPLIKYPRETKSQAKWISPWPWPFSILHTVSVVWTALDGGGRTFNCRMLAIKICSAQLKLKARATHCI